jgi:prevent-host-death family protein
MLDVKIENILPVTEARDSLNKLIDTVEGSDDMFVMTKNGKPAAILVGVHHLEKLTGIAHTDIMDKDEEINNINQEDTMSDDLTTPAAAPTTDDAQTPATPPVAADDTMPAAPADTSMGAPAPTEPAEVPEAPAAPDTFATPGAGDVAPAAPAEGEEEKKDDDAAATPPAATPSL